MLLLNDSNKQYLTDFIKREAKNIGFEYCGISKAIFLEDDAPHLEAWLHAGKHGSMTYMENYFDKRLDPRLLVPGAKSVISFLLNYYPSEIPETNLTIPKIAKYAWGVDYHFVIKDKLKTLIHLLQEKVSYDLQIRAFVDSAPVLDKAWAKKSGLGWIGKNSNLITKKSGSFFFIADLITDLELCYDSPIKDYCGSCTRCIDACPTDAIVGDKIIDATKCISYLTIELKEQIPTSMQNTWQDWIFGCDICQDVCPWNRFSKAHTTHEFTPNPAVLTFTDKDWQDISEEVFQQLFKKSPLKRAKHQKLQQNWKFVRSKS